MDTSFEAMLEELIQDAIDATDGYVESHAFETRLIREHSDGSWGLYDVRVRIADMLRAGKMYEISAHRPEYTWHAHRRDANDPTRLRVQGPEDHAEDAVLHNLYRFGVLPLRDLRERSKNSHAYPTSTVTATIDRLINNGTIHVSSDRIACLAYARDSFLTQYGSLKEANDERGKTETYCLQPSTYLFCNRRVAMERFDWNTMHSITLPTLARSLVATFGDTLTEEQALDFLRSCNGMFINVSRNGDSHYGVEREFVNMIQYAQTYATESS